jgi:hypothetical protein
MLRISAGREGEAGGAHGDVGFTNAGSRPCVLRGVPLVAIARAGGKPLPVRQMRAANLSAGPVVLLPGALDALLFRPIRLFRPIKLSRWATKPIDHQRVLLEALYDPNRTR